MKRSDLLNTLNTVKPALATNDLIPALSMFWFRGKSVMAYNDQIAIRTKLDDTDFVGALPGTMLISLLNSSLADNIEFTAGNQDASIKMGKSKLKLAYLPEDAFDFFTMPKTVKNNRLIVDPASFLTAIESCLRSIGTDVATPDQLGITVVRRKDKLHLYSTDRLTLSFAEIGTLEEPPLDEGESVILSATFCKQMLRLLKWRTPARYVGDDAEEGGAAGEDTAEPKKAVIAPKELALEIGDKHALLAIGDTTLYGRLLKSDRPIDYEGIYKSHVTSQVLSGLVKVPDTLDLVLSRADVIIKTSAVPVATAVKVVDGRAIFHSQTLQGEVDDTLTLDPGHPDSQTSITPSLVKRGCSFFDEICISNKSTVFRRGNMTYLVAAFRGS